MSVSDTTHNELVHRLKEEVKEIAEEDAYWYVTVLDMADCVRVMNGIINGIDKVLEDLPYTDWSGQWCGGPDWDETFDNAAAGIWGDEEDGPEVRDFLFQEVAQEYGAEVTQEAVRKYCAERLGI